MYPILFQIGDISVYTYGFVMMSALILIYFMARRRLHESPLSEDQLDDLGLIVLVSIWVGGGLVQLLVFGSWDWDSLKRMMSYEKLQQVGTVSISSSVALMMGLYCHWRRLPFWRVLDFLVPGFILGYAIQRLFGCFSAGCCYGVPTDVWWSVRFPYTMGIGPTPGVAVHPTQLYLGFTALLVYFLLRRVVRQSPPVGFVTATGLTGLFGFYFAVSFVRADYGDVVLIYGYRLSQLFSFSVFAIGLSVMIWLSLGAVKTERTGG